VTPDGLRNLPFFHYMGGADSAYDRNVVVRESSAKLDELQAVDPTGDSRRLTVFPGLPHNMHRSGRPPILASRRIHGLTCHQFEKD